MLFRSEPCDVCRLRMIVHPPLSPPDRHRDLPDHRAERSRPADPRTSRGPSKNFMLLDEPTSNLDSINEAIILKALFDEQAEKTVVLVSHRQSTMNIADTVYSVESGRIS